MTVEYISSEVLKLSKLQRIELIRLLAESIAREESAQNEIGLTPEQEAEIDRRLVRFDAGQTHTIPGIALHDELAQKYGLQLPTPS